MTSSVYFTSTINNELFMNLKSMHKVVQEKLKFEKDIKKNPNTITKIQEIKI